MGVEGFSGYQEQSEQRPTRKTSERLLVAMEVLLKTQVSGVEVEGQENIDELQPSENPIIATSHIEDPDVPLAVKVFGRMEEPDRTFDVAVTDQSVHHTFSGEPAVYPGLRLAGIDNFIPLSWRKTGKDIDGEKSAVVGKKVPQFNPDDFPPIAEAMQNGKTIVMAAQNPTFTGSLGKGGIGAVYLAQLTGEPVIPFAVDMVKPETGVMKRPLAKTKIGAPIRMEHIEGIEQLAALEQKRKDRNLSDQDKENYLNLLDALRRQSEIVMKAIAAMLPEEKRGIYLDKEVTQ